MMNSTIDPGIPRGFTLEPAGYLLHKVSLFVFLGILVLAAWKGQTGIVILLGLIFSAAGLAALWSRISLVGVRCRRTIRERRLFPGESTELVLQIINRKPIPLPWIKIEHEIPVDIAYELNPIPADRSGYRLLSHSASVLGYKRVSWKCRLLAGKRGYYRLGPLGVTSGDIFGFYPRRASVPLSDSILVYPKILPLEAIAIPSLHPMGDARTRRRIFQDPTQPVGLRDYRPGDSPKYIHWKASARLRELQVKLFEPTVNLQVCVFLVGDLLLDNEAGSEEDFELAVSAAATYACQLIDQAVPVGLVSNTLQVDSMLEVSIPPGGSREQLLQILEALAKATRKSKAAPEVFLQREMAHSPSGTTLILIASHFGPSLLWFANDLKEKGHRLLLVETGDMPDRPQGDLPVYRIHGRGRIPRGDGNKK